jgi:hypothetical protein
LFLKPQEKADSKIEYRPRLALVKQSFAKPRKDSLEKRPTLLVLQVKQSAIGICMISARKQNETASEFGKSKRNPSATDS